MLTKYILTLLALIGLLAPSGAQEALNKLDLEEAYALFEAQYPALQDHALISQIHQAEIKKLDKDRLPTIHLNAEGRLQSESPNIDLPEGIQLPFEIDLPLYSSKAYIEAQYNLYDGGINNAQKKLKDQQFFTDAQSLEVDRYHLKQRINELFINITMLREQATLFDLSLKDLKQRKENVEAAVAEGVMLDTELKKLSVKELELKAKKDNINYKIKSLIMTLAVVVDRPLQGNIQLILPVFPEPTYLPDIQRPELQLLAHKQSALLANADLIDAASRPKIGAFLQGGIGYPNPLNFLDNEAAPYGLVGFKVQWPIINWKKDEVSKEVLTLQSLRLENAKETLKFNLRSKEAMYLYEVANIENQQTRLIEIADLEKDILTQLAFQLDEGVINTAEYIIQVNAELKARQNILINQTELLKLQIEFWNERGALLGEINN